MIQVNPAHLISGTFNTHLNEINEEVIVDPDKYSRLARQKRNRH